MPKDRGKSFSQNEVLSLLDVIEELKPCETSTWEAVARIHRSRYPDQNRTTDSLRKKFNNLSSTKVPSGAPHCPLEVREAKRIRKEMNKDVNKKNTCKTRYIYNTCVYTNLLSVYYNKGNRNSSFAF